ncbi:hypothetical protein BDW74DRAFT_161666 [Aspergillus multicolor]|uniref:uncharacterized protein n=1 Tax=Aspergillus multicolor TaxID=41759 RepID=UPI003CCE522F
MFGIIWVGQRSLTFGERRKGAKWTLSISLLFSLFYSHPSKIQCVSPRFLTYRLPPLTLAPFLLVVAHTIRSHSFKFRIQVVDTVCNRAQILFTVILEFMSAHDEPSCNHGGLFLWRNRLYIILAFDHIHQ